MLRIVQGTLFLILLFVIGCASKPKVESWQLSEGKPRKALMVVDVLLKAEGLMSSDHECKMKARYEDGTEMSFKIRPGQRRYFWSVPQGSYEMKHMSCGLFTEFDLSSFPRFRVKNARSYYFGQLKLELKNKESLSWSLPVLEKDEFLVQYLSLPNSLKPELYSPYSAKKITDSKIRRTPLEPRIQAEGKVAMADELQRNWPLKQCQSEERKRNPVWGGEYILEVLSQEGLKFVESNDATEHLYTKEFQNCSTKALTHWLSQQASSDFKMEIRL